MYGMVYLHTYIPQTITHGRHPTDGCLDGLVEENIYRTGLKQLKSCREETTATWPTWMSGFSAHFSTMNWGTCLTVVKLLVDLSKITLLPTTLIGLGYVWAGCFNHPSEKKHGKHVQRVALHGPIWVAAKSGHVVSIIFNIVQWDSYLASMNEFVKHNKSLITTSCSSKNEYVVLWETHEQHKTPASWLLYSHVPCR